MPKQNSELTKQLQRLRQQKNILWVGVLFFALVVLWILVSIFTSSRTSSITAEQRELAKPFVPRLESVIFDQILTRRPYDAGELGLFPVFVLGISDYGDEPRLVDITSELQQQLAEEEVMEKVESAPVNDGAIEVVETESLPPDENETDLD